MPEGSKGGLNNENSGNKIIRRVGIILGKGGKGDTIRAKHEHAAHPNTHRRCERWRSLLQAGLRIRGVRSSYYNSYYSALL